MITTIPAMQNYLSDLLERNKEANNDKRSNGMDSVCTVSRLVECIDGESLPETHDNDRNRPVPTCNHSPCEWSQFPD